MLMTKPALSPHAQKVLDALTAKRGQWLGRNELAKQIGKARLNAYEQGMLELLYQLGYIEVRKVADPRPMGFRFEYRLKEESIE